MSAEPAPGLHTAEGQRVPLTGVSANGRLDGLLFELTVEQHYRNTSRAAIETVFTFPLPLHAVLLSFELTLNGKRHMATAFAREQAERKYETAIDDGNSAALLVQDGNGLYTVNVANLKPGEEATVRYRYAELQRAHRNQVRLNLPTVIAPRYGNPSDAGLEGPAIPGADLFTEFPFGLRLEISGISEANRIKSPSHQISTRAVESGVAVELARSAFLDRDFVLTVDHATAPAGSQVAVDGEGFVALVSAAMPADETSRPLVAKLLLDCSGSMAGDSIDAAKRALIQLLAGLNETDTFSLTRFGSRVEHVTEGMEPADAHSIKPVSQLVQRMAANLGGTEMPAAIRETIRIPVPAGTRADLVLITDGEVHAVDEVVDVAERSGHRLFVIAIGAAPNEALARKVSERTGGACDFVAAGEQVEGAILRMFGRLRAAPRTIARIDWSTPPEWTAPLPSAVFPHDTIHVMAGFRARPEGSARVTVSQENGSATVLDVKLTPTLGTQDVVPRIAAAQRLATLTEAEARELAVRYQLVSAFTSLVLVAERAEGDKVLELPNTVAVPHMLAAGWGGAAEVADMCFAAPVAGSFEISSDRPGHSMARVAASMEPPVERASMARYGYAELRMDLRRETQIEIPAELRDAIVASVVAALANGQALPQDVNELDAMCKLPDEFKATLSLLCALNDEEDAIFIRALLEHLDRKHHLISFPAIGAVDRIRLRTLRRRFETALPVQGAPP